MKLTRLNIGLIITVCIASFFSYQYFVTKKLSRKAKFDAIIFDLDGTIVNTDPLWKQATIKAFEDYLPNLDETEKNIIEQDCQKFDAVQTVLYMIDYLEKNHAIKKTRTNIFVDCMPYLVEIYKTKGIEFIPHFDMFHKKVIDYGLPCAIATSSQQHLIETIIEIVPLKNYFNEHIYHVDHVGQKYKPAPDVYLHAAKQLNVHPERCIAIEDSHTGIAAAKAAGMYCIAINTGKNKELLHQADHIVECYSEINLEKLLGQ
ncbi:MAG: HAD family hydrolase [Candidatus Chromulinivorax sp.]